MVENVGEITLVTFGMRHLDVSAIELKKSKTALKKKNQQLKIYVRIMSSKLILFPTCAELFKKKQRKKKKKEMSGNLLSFCHVRVTDFCQ